MRGQELVCDELQVQFAQQSQAPVRPAQAQLTTLAVRFRLIFSSKCPAAGTPCVLLGIGGLPGGTVLLARLLRLSLCADAAHQGEATQW